MNPYNRQFKLRQEEPRYWHNKSGDLFISARTLWKAMQSEKNLQSNCWATYKMLMGMSFEQLFKAHCIGLGVEFKLTHNLVELARATRLALSEDEYKILKVLSEYVIWDGRYPTPKKPEHLKDHWESQDNSLDDKLGFENLTPLWRRFSDPFIEQYE